MGPYGCWYTDRGLVSRTVTTMDGTKDRHGWTIVKIKVNGPCFPWNSKNLTPTVTGETVSLYERWTVPRPSSMPSPRRRRQVYNG